MDRLECNHYRLCGFGFPPRSMLRGEPELDFYDGPVREYTGLRYGLSTNGLQARLERLEKPDLVAIPASFTSQKDEVLLMVKTVRKVWPEVPTVVGGHYATFAYESLLSTGQISAVCLGESWI